jgi:TatD DNase family protein
MLTEHRAALRGGVAHCFTEGPEELEAYLGLDLSIGITGWVCDERRGGALRAAVPRIPRQKLLLETDAPYLLPRDLTPRPKSRRNEPAYLPHIAATVAALRGESLASVAEAATQNAVRLFGLDAA